MMVMDMDFSTVKSIVIPEGQVKQITSNGAVLWKSGYKNWVRYSINADGTIYNNGLGYKNDYRVRSGGTETTSIGGCCTGFIPVSPGEAVYVSGVPWFTGVSAANALNAADSSFTNIGQFTMGQNAKYGIFASAYSAYAASSVVEVSSGVWKWIVPPAASGVAYIRISGYNANNTAKPLGADLIVTINEEIA